MSHQPPNTQLLHCRQMKAVKGTAVDSGLCVLLYCDRENLACQRTDQKWMTCNFLSQPFARSEIPGWTHVSSEVKPSQLNGSFKFCERTHHHYCLTLDRKNHVLEMRITDEHFQKATCIVTIQVFKKS